MPQIKSPLVLAVALVISTTLQKKLATYLLAQNVDQPAHFQKCNHT